MKHVILLVLVRFIDHCYLILVKLRKLKYQNFYFKIEPQIKVSHYDYVIYWSHVYLSLIVQKMKF